MSLGYRNPEQKLEAARVGDKWKIECIAYKHTCAHTGKHLDEAHCRQAEHCCCCCLLLFVCWWLNVQATC